MHAIGIDLGTTNSAVAVFENGAPVMIPNALGDRLTPSVVSLIDGQVVVGKIAAERRITHPGETVALFKRAMGTNEKLRLGQKTMAAHELSALVLKSLKADAQAYLDAEVTEAVISVPAYFTNPQRKATALAAELAGLRVSRIINEPTAAAIAYGIQERPQGSRFVVLDLGGGTFDVSLMEYFDGVLEVHATAGDSFLGGEDFTQALVDYFLAENNKKKRKLDPHDLEKIRRRCEHVKRRLDGQNAQGVSYGDWKSVTIDKRTEERLFTPLLQRVLAPVSRAIRDAGINPTELDEVLLVGGATRMHSFRTAATRMFRRFPEASLDPDCVVAMGAALQAALHMRDSALDDVVLTDVCPHTLGTEVIDRGVAGQFMPIIERNVVVPCSIARMVGTSRDNQDRVEIKIYQGERRLAAENTFLGKVDVPVPPGPVGKEAIEIRYSYDVSGLLEVDVRVLSTGHAANLTLDSGLSELTDEEKEESSRTLAALKHHPRELQENQAVLSRGERLYEESLGDVRTEVGDLIAVFEQALERQDVREIREVREKVEDALDQLERPWQQ